MNKRSFVRGVIALSIAATVVATAGAPALAANVNQREGWPAEFKVGIFAGSDAEKSIKDNEPLRAYLEKSLGIPVKIQTAISYSAVVEALRSKQVDAMRVGPFAHVLAVQQAKAEPIAVAVYPRVPKGGVAKISSSDSPFYYSVIFTKKGSGINSLQDLKGKDFAFVDPASTSGHLMPKTLLIQNKIDPDKEMKTFFAGSHPASVLAVWNDKVPAGATYEDNLYTLAANGQIDFCGFADSINRQRTLEEVKLKFNGCKDGQIAILAYSPTIPTEPMAVRPGMPESFKAALKDALLKIKDDPALVAQTKEYYVDPTGKFKLKKLDDFYNGLRAAAQFLKLDLTKLK